MSRFSPRSNYEKSAGPLIPARKRRILFVCIGNAVRSQMAQAFAKKYGADLVEAESAGLAPAEAVAPLTLKVLRDRGVPVEDQFPKHLLEVSGPFDFVVNISGLTLPGAYARGSREWSVDDPFLEPGSAYIETANRIETLVMALLLELRTPHRSR
jgi:arsenate reductase